MTYLPLPIARGDSAPMRLQRDLLRHVREAAHTQEPLPGEPQLTELLGCTRQQLRNAMTHLEAQGIVRRRQGAVTTVDPIALRLSVRLEEQFEHADLLDRLGYRAEVEILGTTRTVLTSEIAATMEHTEGAPALAMRKRWRADGAVAMIADDVVPLDLQIASGGPPPAPPGPDESVFAFAARASGEPVIWEVATPGLTTLDTELAALFEREVGSPVMTLEIVGIGASGRRLMHSFEYHDPHIVSYSLVRTVRPPWRGTR